MRTTRHYNEREVFFAIADLDPALRQAAHDLAYSEVNGEWVDSYPRNTPHIDRIFQTFSQAIGPMLRQAAGLQPIRWESALDDFLRIVEGEDLDWWLGGSAALAVRGLPITPRDFDIVIDDAGARRLADLLLPA
ncbi:MAG TPA: hypothetical protein VD886_20800, partial [Herpetosiphonaceae bacterium]|nr:hypothetical protein [Herpetosiphonaceae bacterium]